MVNPRAAQAKKSGKAKPILITIGIIIGIELLIQLVWPNTILTPNTKIDGENFSLWDKTKVASTLDSIYKNMSVELYFGDNSEPYIISSMDDAGIKVSNYRRVSHMNYPPHWRLVPTSLFWHGLLNQPDSPQTSVDDVATNDFLLKNFDEGNYIKPIDAGLVMTESSIDLKKSQVGGEFSFSNLKEALLKPDYSSRKAVVKVDISSEYPRVNDKQALDVATVVSGQLINDLELTFEDYNKKVVLPVKTLREWITFSVVDGKLMPIINEKKLNSFLSSEVAPLIETAAGTTIITTNDIASINRSEGGEGKVLNTVETGWRLTEYLLGKRQTVVVAVESVDPDVEYVYERIRDNAPVNNNSSDNDDEGPEDSDELVAPESFI